MANTLVQQGKRIDYTNAGAAITSGTLIGPFGTGDRFGVAVADIADGQVTPVVGQIEIEGVHALDATSANVWADGDILYWDPATDKLTDVAGSLKRIGTAVGAKASSVTTARVKFDV